MKFAQLDLAGIYLVEPKKFGDDRGFFMETFKSSAFCEAVSAHIEFVQDNHSFSAQPYTVRGLHYQSPPHAQGKLVRCTRGRILDVAVDVRQGSPTFGEHISVELTAENGAQLWVPAGFLHGFLTLEPNTEVVYKCTDYYSPECDGNILWNDPDLAVDWGIDGAQAVLSDKDRNAPRFRDFDSPFIVD